ncbi:RNA polymerase I specific transcription initiation factor RRN3, partial [Oesophagostomum dentatum]
LFQRLNWHVIPEEIFEKFVNTLCDISIRQVCHTEAIYAAAVNSLIPVVKENAETETMEPALSIEDQTRLYNFAHRIIAHILKCFPMSGKALLRVFRVSVPHISHDSHRFIGYIRNLVQCIEYIGKLRAEVWEIIIDQMITCDNMLTKLESRDERKSNLDSTIFAMDEDQRKGNESEENDRLAKLDGGVRDVLCYIACKHSIDREFFEDTKWLSLSDESTTEELFTIFLSLLESRMLLSVHVRFTSFLWLYFSNINESYASRTLDLLWSVIVRPQVAQADVAKAHGAAAYLAAFLARANYLDVRVSMSWMFRIVKWCLQYIDSCGIASKQVVPGVIRHGTFYALCQAFFIIFSFRYREVVQNGGMDEIGRWGVSRIVHSPLDPLKYVSGPVGQCFAAISRSLQLVYCNHVLPLESDSRLPFEPMFPFDSYKLKSSVDLIKPLLRRFSPLAEDKNEVTSVLRCSKLRLSQDESMDFLDNEDEIMASFSTCTPIMTQCINHPSMFTIYSTSPGLRHFESTMG